MDATQVFDQNVLPPYYMYLYSIHNQEVDAASMQFYDHS